MVKPTIVQIGRSHSILSRCNRLTSVACAEPAIEVNVMVITKAINKPIRKRKSRK